MSINIPIDISIEGVSKTIADFQAIQKAIERTVQQSAGINALAQSLSLTYKEAKLLAQEIGLTGEETAKAVSALKQLRAVGADAATQFQTLSGKLGINEQQFQKLSKSLDNVSKQAGIGDRLRQGFTAAGGSIAQTAFAFNQIVAALGLLSGAAQKAYGLLIGQNVELQNQLIGTQATLAATNKVLTDGVQIKDPTAAIQALEGPVKEAIARVRQGSLELSGVTSQQLIPLFQIVAGQSSQIGANLTQSADLTLSFGAALKTLGIPLEQANQEIRSILQGQIISDSQLARSLNLNNEMVNQWRNQGVLVDKLNEKLAAFRASNKLQAQTLDGVSSNILEVLQELGRIAGEPLLGALTEQLNQLFNFLNANKSTLIEVAQQASDRFLSFAEAVGESVVQIGNALLPAIKSLGPFALEIIDLVRQGFQSLAAAAAAIATAIGPALEGAVKLSTELLKSVRLAQQGIGLLTGSANDSTEALEASARAVAQLSTESIALQSKLKAAIAARNQAQADGRDLTEEETKANAALEARKQSLIQAMQQELRALDQQVPIGEENRRNLEAQRKELESRIKALQADSLELDKNAKNIKLVADASQEAQTKLAGLKQQLKSGLADEDQALKELNAIKNNAEVSRELRKEAADEAIAIRKKQTDSEIALLEAQKEQIEAKVKSGFLGEATAQQQITEIQRQEIQKRLQLNREEQAIARGSDKQKLIAEEKKLQTELTVLNAEAGRKRKEELLRNFDERKSILEGQYAQGLLSQEEFNRQSLQLDLAKNDEELRQLQEQLKKLSSTDKEGREAINAKIGEVYQKRQEIIRAAYDRERQAIEEATNKSIAQSRLAETKRQQEIQSLKNSGAITARQAEQLQSDSKLKFIDQEIAAEQTKYQKIKQLRAVDAESAKQKDKDLLASQQKLADLTLQKLQEQGAAEERLRQAAIDRIKQQQQIEQSATRIAVVGIQSKILELNREKEAQDAIGRSLERQQKLAETAFNLEKSRAEATVNYYAAQIAGASKALELIRQYNQESDPEKKIQQEQLLQALGLSALTNQQGELNLLKQKQALEDAQAAAKEQQRQAEQIFAKNQLELNLKKMQMEGRLQLIAAKRAEYEAKITEQKAKQSLSDAQAELKQAKLIKDPEERKAAIAAAEATIAEAKQGVADAREQQQLAKDQRADATQNLIDIEKIGEKQRQALKVQQETENAIAGQAEGMRQLNQILEISQQGAEGFAAALQKAQAATQVIKGVLSGAQLPQARFTGGEVAPGQAYTVAESGPEIIRYPDGSFDYVPAPSLIRPDRRGYVLNARETAAFLSRQTQTALIGAMVSPQEINLKSEFARLTDAIYMLAYTPRSLTMQSDRPLSDAAEYTRELVRQRARLKGW